MWGSHPGPASLASITNRAYLVVLRLLISLKRKYSIITKLTHWFQAPWLPMFLGNCAGSTFYYSHATVWWWWRRLTGVVYVCGLWVPVESIKRSHVQHIKGESGIRVVFHDFFSTRSVWWCLYPHREVTVSTIQHSPQSYTLHKIIASPSLFITLEGPPCCRL